MSQPVEYTIEPSPVSFRRKRRGVEAEMDITPMIDITFLLLIFFLVASRMSQEAFVELPTAKNGTTVSNETSVVITVTKGNGENAVFYKGDGVEADTRLASTDANDQLQELSDYIAEGLNGTMTQVLIKAEKGVRHRDVARAAKAAGGATARVMFVAVVEER